MASNITASDLQSRLQHHRDLIGEEKEAIQRSEIAVQRSEIAIQELEALLAALSKKGKDEETSETWHSAAMGYLSRPHTAPEVHKYIAKRGWTEVTLNNVRVWMSRRVGKELTKLTRGVYARTGYKGAKKGK